MYYDINALHEKKNADYFFFYMDEENLNSFCVCTIIEKTIACGSLVEGDVLVIDNVTINVCGKNNNIIEFL